MPTPAAQAEHDVFVPGSSILSPWITGSPSVSTNIQVDDLGINLKMNEWLLGLGRQLESSSLLPHDSFVCFMLRWQGMPSLQRLLLFHTLEHNYMASTRAGLQNIARVMELTLKEPSNRQG